MAYATKEKELANKKRYYIENRDIILLKKKLKPQKVKKKTKEQYKKYRETKQSKPDFLHKCLLSQAKIRANKKNIPFNIDLSDIVIPNFCPVLGIPLYKGDGTICDNSPTLDRFDNSKGYVKGNVYVISWRANNLKNDGVLEEFECIVRYMKGEFLNATN